MPDELTFIRHRLSRYIATTKIQLERPPLTLNSTPSALDQKTIASHKKLSA
jgi:hypothetical protein